MAEPERSDILPRDVEVHVSDWDIVVGAAGVRVAAEGTVRVVSRPGRSGVMRVAGSRIELDRDVAVVDGQTLDGWAPWWWSAAILAAVLPRVLGMLARGEVEVDDAG